MHVISADTTVADTISHTSIGSDPIIVRSLISGYAHVFIQLSGVISTLPCTIGLLRFQHRYGRAVVITLETVAQVVCCLVATTIMW